MSETESTLEAKVANVPAADKGLSGEKVSDAAEQPTRVEQELTEQSGQKSKVEDCKSDSNNTEKTETSALALTEVEPQEQLPGGVFIPTDMVPVRRIGLVVFGLVFGVFGLWSLIAPLDSAALAPGVVQVKSHKKTVQHLEGGIVKEIRVRSGDQVAAGDVLMVLDDTQSSAQLEIMRGQYIAAKTKEARLFAERDDLGLIDYPAVLPKDDPRTTEEVASQNQLFTARRNARNGEISVLQQRVEQLQAKIKGLEALKKSKESLVSSYREEIGDYSELLREGFADKIRLRELERNHARLEGEVAELISSISGTHVQVGEAQLQILQLQKDFHTEVVDELAKTQTGLNDVEERLRAIEDMVARTQVRSPVAGLVHNLEIHTIGAVLAPGTPIADIIPQSEELIVEAQLSPVDIDRVFKGQEAMIRFSAFKSSTPVIEGKVISLSADRLVNEQTGMPYYSTRVEVTEKGMADLAGLELLPGMPAEVLINTGSRTLFQYMVQPISDSFARSLIED